MAHNLEALRKQSSKPRKHKRKTIVRTTCLKSAFRATQLTAAKRKSHKLRAFMYGSTLQTKFYLSERIEGTLFPVLRTNGFYRDVNPWV